MVYLFIRHHVSDYARWREGYDLHVAAREAGGATSEALVLRDAADPNDITVILGWHDLDQARAFTRSASFKDAVQMAGVVRLMEIRFLTRAS
jgi:heme-degrading monooxygenase HmoA